MRDKFYNFFPTSSTSRILYQIKYFIQNIIFNKCVSEETKRLNILKTSLQIEHATEAYEVLWKNLGYTTIQKYLYLSLSIIATLILVGLSLCIVLLFNHIQYNLTESNAKKFWKYLLNFIILYIIVSALTWLCLRIINNKDVQTDNENAVSNTLEVQNV